MSATQAKLGRLVASVVVVLAGLMPAARSQELHLSIAPFIVNPGDTINFDVSAGVPTAPVAVYVSQMGFAPVFFRVALGTFDAMGNWVVQGEAPTDPALDNVDITFVAYGIAASDFRFHGSNYVTVSFRSS